MPDTAVGQHGWCKGCGAIIRVPASSEASPDDIVDVKIDPQVQALLHHMASQLTKYRARAKETEAKLLALGNERSSRGAEQKVTHQAEALSEKFDNQLSAFEKERQSIGVELREFLASMRELLQSISRPDPGTPVGSEQDRLDELEKALAAERAGHASTNEELHALQNQYSGVMKENEGRVAELERLQQRLEGAEENARELAERCGRLDEQVASLRAERDDARRMLEERRAAEETPEVVTARLQEKESVIQRLSEELRIISASKGEIEAVSKQRLDDIEHLSAELSGLSQSAEAEILEIQSELSIERKGHALAERALTQAQDDLRALRREVDALRQIETQKEVLEREVVLLRESLQKAEETIQGTQARLEESREKLRKAENQPQTFRETGVTFQKTRASEKTLDEVSQDRGIAKQDVAERGPSFIEGPFPGPFVPPSEQGDRVEGLALIPEVIDEDYDDREMLDTLMRFLEPDE
ncbi:MAG: hypothetical protein R6V12_07195 [Candidatus Hydrogenedentota bacterium]